MIYTLGEVLRVAEDRIPETALEWVEMLVD